MQVTNNQIFQSQFFKIKTNFEQTKSEASSQIEVICIRMQQHMDALHQTANLLMNYVEGNPEQYRILVENIPVGESGDSVPVIKSLFQTLGKEIPELAVGFDIEGIPGIKKSLRKTTELYEKTLVKGVKDNDIVSSAYFDHKGELKNILQSSERETSLINSIEGGLLAGKTAVSYTHLTLPTNREV